MSETQVNIQFYRDQEEKDQVLPLKWVSVAHQMPSDEVLWKAFRKGDEEALTCIYNQYVGKMYNYGCQFTQEREIVRDCIQELFVELIHKRRQLGNTASIKFYLFKSLRRKLMRSLKKKQLYVSTKETHAPGNFKVLEDPCTKFIHQEVSQQTKTIITEGCNQLPAKQREALLLYFYEGLSYREIAETMGMTRTKSARVLIYRAIASLSSRLARYKEIFFPLGLIITLFS